MAMLNNDEAHLETSLRRVGLLFGGVSTVCTVIAVYISGHPHRAAVDENANFTAFARANYQFYPNGNGSMYVPLYNGTHFVESYHHPAILQLLERYYFGSSGFNFCRERNIPRAEAGSSLFRASQLYASVQTFLRYAVLVSMCPQLLQAIVFAKCARNGDGWQFRAIGNVYIINEILYYTSLFFVASIHVWQDRDYLPLSSAYVHVAVGFAVVKLLLGAFIHGSHRGWTFRVMGAVLLISTLPLISADVDAFKKELFCDAYVSPKAALAQLVALTILLIDTWANILASKQFVVRIGPSSDDVLPSNSEAKSNLGFIF